MPQIKLFLNQKAQNMFDGTFDELGARLTAVIEKVFGIQGKNDVAFDVFGVIYTKNEAPVQIEVHYTAGTDEYNTGQVFDPTRVEQMKAVDEIRAAFQLFQFEQGIEAIHPSVWICPVYKSLFQSGCVEG